MLHGPDGGAIDALRRCIDASALTCWPLLRSDHCLRLEGPLAADVLSTVCDIDDRIFVRRPQAVALVFAAGIPVALHALAGARGYAFWCDPTWSFHLHHTLRERLTR